MLLEELQILIKLAPRRYPELEEEIFKSRDLMHAYLYTLCPNIWEDLPGLALYYAQVFLNGRWPVAEPLIRSEARSAYRYALEILRGRWIQAEDVIKEHPEYAYRYAVHILKQRWIEAEECISKDSHYASLYETYIRACRVWETNTACK